MYGSLMDPWVLRGVLGGKDTPKLRPAKTVGCRIRMSGPYPALLDGEPGQVVRGMACEVEGGENGERLAAYETGPTRRMQSLHFY